MGELGLTSERQRAMTLRDYLHVLRRRRWIVIVPVVLAPIIAGELAHRQPKLYKASAQVTVSQLDLPSSDDAINRRANHGATEINLRLVDVDLRQRHRGVGRAE